MRFWFHFFFFTGRIQPLNRGNGVIVEHPEMTVVTGAHADFAGLGDVVTYYVAAVFFLRGGRILLVRFFFCLLRFEERKVME